MSSKFDFDCVECRWALSESLAGQIPRPIFCSNMGLASMSAAERGRDSGISTAVQASEDLLVVGSTTPRFCTKALITGEANGDSPGSTGIEEAEQMRCF